MEKKNPTCPRRRIWGQVIFVYNSTARRPPVDITRETRTRTHPPPSTQTREAAAATTTSPRPARHAATTPPADTPPRTYGRVPVSVESVSAVVCLFLFLYRRVISGADAIFCFSPFFFFFSRLFFFFSLAFFLFPRLQNIIRVRRRRSTRNGSSVADDDDDDVTLKRSFRLFARARAQRTPPRRWTTTSCASGSVWTRCPARTDGSPSTNSSARARTAKCSVPKTR